MIESLYVRPSVCPVTQTLDYEALHTSKRPSVHPSVHLVSHNPAKLDPPPPYLKASVRSSVHPSIPLPHEALHTSKRSCLFSCFPWASSVLCLFHNLWLFFSAEADLPRASNMKRLPNAVSMLGQRRRRWPNIDPTFGEHRHRHSHRCSSDGGGLSKMTLRFWLNPSDSDV